MVSHTVQEQTNICASNYIEEMSSLTPRAGELELYSRMIWCFNELKKNNQVKSWIFLRPTY